MQKQFDPAKLKNQFFDCTLFALVETHLYQQL